MELIIIFTHNDDNEPIVNHLFNIIGLEPECGILLNIKEANYIIKKNEERDVIGNAVIPDISTLVVLHDKFDYNGEENSARDIKKFILEVVKRADNVYVIYHIGQKDEKIKKSQREMFDKSTHCIEEHHNDEKINSMLISITEAINSKDEDAFTLYFDNLKNLITDEAPIHKTIQNFEIYLKFIHEQLDDNLLKEDGEIDSSKFNDYANIKLGPFATNNYQTLKDFCEYTCKLDKKIRTQIIAKIKLQLIKNIEEIFQEGK